MHKKNQLSINPSVQNSENMEVKRSVKGLLWKQKEFNEQKKRTLAQKTGLHEVLSQCLAIRGVSPDRVESFLEPKLKTEMINPSLLQDMDKAASILIDAFETKTKIAVFADYDVDGGSSAAQLIRYGQLLGVEIDFYVPDRVSEGYGPTKEAFENLKSRGNHLVVTVDCGSVAYDALQSAFDLGLEVIVVDHHLMGRQELPKNRALVNPNRLDDESGADTLTAAGVVFLLLVALNREGRKRKFFEKTGVCEPDLFPFLGLVSLGTVCDVAPLTGLNRAFVSQGLKALKTETWPGLKALAEISGGISHFKSYHLGFVLGPRLNAAGRIGKADMALRLMITRDEKEAQKLANYLDSYNRERQSLEKKITYEAIEKVERLQEKPEILVIEGYDWHVGVLGIVASRLKEIYNRPAIVIGFDRKTKTGKASGRSIEGVNLGEAIVCARQEGLLLNGGGHSMAVGLSLEEAKLLLFKTYIEKKLLLEIKSARKDSCLGIEAPLSFKTANADFVSSLEALEPYGKGNGEPVFLFSDINIIYSREVGTDHVQATLKDKYGNQMQAIAFKAKQNKLFIPLIEPSSNFIKIAGRLNINEWKGQKKVNLQILDIMI